MKTYHFTVVVRDASNTLEDLEDQFFAAGCDDALLCSYNDTIYLEFDRESENAKTAITSALSDIQKLGFKDLIVEEHGFATLAEMAERANLTRQALSLYALGRRGKGKFPRPMYGVTTPKSALYSWPEVATWLHSQGTLNDTVLEVATTRI